MANREEKSALENLQHLVANDLSDIDVETLAEGVRSAELALERSPEWSGKLIAEMKTRGMSWTQIVETIGLPRATLYRRAQPYLPSGSTGSGT